jgi:hypothetical protein
VEVAQSASAILSRLEGDDLVIRSLPGSGLLMPGKNTAIVTGDGLVIVDENHDPLYFITPSGLVIGKLSDIYRDSLAAAAHQKKISEPKHEE